MAAITSNITRRLHGEHVIVYWQEAGLLFPSVVTGIIHIIKRTMIDRKLGTMAPSDMAMLANSLRQSLGL